MVITDNVQVQIQDHQSFETEVGASQERVQAVVAEGNNLLRDDKCGDREEIVSFTHCCIVPQK